MADFYSGNGVPVSGTAGTDRFANLGDGYVNTANGQWYSNTSTTRSSPTWTAIPSSSSFPTSLTLGVATTALAPIDFNTVGNNGLFRIIAGGATFNSVFDDVLYWGYNATNGGSKINSAEPRLNLSLEANYFNAGIHAMEYNFDFTSTDGTVTTRPMYFLIDRDTGTTYFWQFRIGTLGSSQFAVLDHTGVTTHFSVAPTGNVLVGTDLQLARTSGDPAIQATGTDKSIRFVTGLGTVYVLGNSGAQAYIGIQIGDSKLNNDVANTLSVSQNFTVGRKLFRTPSGGLTLTAPSAITVAYSIVQINAAGNITLTSTPTIAAGTDGQEIILYNYGTNTITIQDRGTLGGSNLFLDTATVAIGPKQSVKLFYSVPAGAWVQSGHLVAVL